MLWYMGEEYVPTMLQRLNEAFQEAKDNTEQVRKKNQELYNRKAQEQDFQAGDAVYYFRPQLGKDLSRKFSEKWKPHYRIVEKISPVNYRIRSQVSGKQKVVHVENLRAAHPENVWDEEKGEPKTVLHKLRRAPERVQPGRKCKLVGNPEAQGSSDSTSDESSDEEEDEEKFQDAQSILPRQQVKVQLPDEDSSDSEDDVPLSQLRFKRRRSPSPTGKEEEWKRIKEEEMTGVKRNRSPSPEGDRKRNKQETEESPMETDSRAIHLITELLAYFGLRQK